MAVKLLRELVGDILGTALPKTVERTKTALQLGVVGIFVMLILAGLAMVLVARSGPLPGPALAVLALIVLAALGLVTFIVAAFRSVRSATQQTMDATADGYDVPSTLVVFDHGPPDAEGRYRLHVTRVSTVRALDDGDFTFKIRRRTSGAVAASHSVSHPVRAEVWGDGSARGGSHVPFRGAKAGQQFLVVEEDTRSLVVGAGMSDPEPDDVPLRVLKREFMRTTDHEYVGTLGDALTRHVRLLVYFDAAACPEQLAGVTINREGRVDTQAVRVERVPGRNLFVVETHDLPVGGGVFAYWVWPAAMPTPGVPQVAQVPVADS